MLSFSDVHGVHCQWHQHCLPSRRASRLLANTSTYNEYLLLHNGDFHTTEVFCRLVEEAVDILLSSFCIECWNRLKVTPSEWISRPYYIISSAFSYQQETRSKLSVWSTHDQLWRVFSFEYPCLIKLASCSLQYSRGIFMEHHLYLNII